MLLVLPADAVEPRLAASMFRDRTRQFRDRLGWPVTVVDGEERDQYDAEDPMYVIWQEADGSHGGSLRLLPTTGRTMTAEHFLHLTGGVALQSPFIWEATRFCLAPTASPRVAAALMLGATEAMRDAGVDHLLGVFDAPMLRVYRRLGHAPDVLGEAGGICAGLWAVDGAARARLMRRAGLDEAALAGLMFAPALPMPATFPLSLAA